MYTLDDYDYHLPERLIAQTPVAHRDGSRLLRLERDAGTVSHAQFQDLIHFLRPTDLMVINDTRVIPGRLYGRKETGGKAEILILDYGQGESVAHKAPDPVYHCLIKASKQARPGTRIRFDEGLVGEVRDFVEGVYTVSFSASDPLDVIMEKIGRMPLPPYIKRNEDRFDAVDRSRYQTVYARHQGAVAAPTAGLHFTETLLSRIRDKGVAIVPITLHVGYGTFKPVRVDDIRAHRMHEEWFSISPQSARAINRAKARGRRVVAVGTTSVRTLEYAAGGKGRIRSGSGQCDLFIYPGYTFSVIDAMITNFHLPRSTLLMLVSAFAGRETMLQAYAEAVAEGYRFFSYGDAMLIE